MPQFDFGRSFGCDSYMNNPIVVRDLGMGTVCVWELGLS